MIYHLAPNGKIGLVLANGALSTQTSGEGEIRRKIIEADLIEGIVAMPTQLFYSVTIPVTLWRIPLAARPLVSPGIVPASAELSESGGIGVEDSVVRMSITTSIKV